MSIVFKIANAAGSDVVVNTIVKKISANIVTPLIELIFGLAVLLFAWGVVGFFMNGDDTSKREESRRHILWGVIGMTIMVSVYGIVRLVANTVGTSSSLPF
jgi:hypothetical protein